MPYATLSRYGIRTPRTIAAIGRKHVVEAANAFSGSFIPKHNRAGKGLGCGSFTRDSVVCATIYPAHPVRDRQGVAKPFDRNQHDAFQDLLQQIGHPVCVAIKHAVWCAVRNSVSPASFPALNQRHARLARRVALRQMTFTDGPSAQLALWQDKFDPVARLANGWGHS